MSGTHPSYDVIVVGAGPAGMMASITAGREGASVLLLEKNEEAGAKLKLTGHGRCNITNSRIPENFKEKYFENARFLYSAFSAFSPEDTRAFFDGIGVPTHEEEEGRVFPDSQKAEDVRRALENCLKKEGVEVIYSSPVTNIRKNQEEGYWKTECGKEIYTSRKLILATGGKSFSRTGSSGDGYALIKKAGWGVTPLAPGLAPIFLKSFGEYAEDGEGTVPAGLTLSDAGTSLWIEGKKAGSARGELLFTHQGVSGPAAMRLSRKLPGDGKLYKENMVIFRIDLLPDLKEEEVGKMLLAAMEENPNRHLKRIICETFHFQEKIAEMVLSDDVPANACTKQMRKDLVGRIKGSAFAVEKETPIDIAYVTCGGADLRQISPKTFEVKDGSGLYIVGELLDIDGDSGGYNLQHAWSSGYVAGRSAAQEALSGK